MIITTTKTISTKATATITPPRFHHSDRFYDTTDLINLEIGIAMGCTISPILFVMAMEVILKAAEDSAGPANLGGGCYSLL
ncbi:hypothetical protein RRG08_012169 [Elysia crispata]|uniref:Uncharacterized protein n=1 Tax=Elysia crispata TaxID=231223 RepID=A0AAE0ZL27_9GAST|nr:hypothetical protein RRG08_012169 [Elysia crispata]